MSGLHLIIAFLLLTSTVCYGQQSSLAEDPTFLKAAANGRIANEGFVRCNRYVEGWLKQADPRTGLIPKNLYESKDIWNPEDSAADNYPFMVLTAAILDRPLFTGRMLHILRAETKLTSRIGSLPDTYSFSRKAFEYTIPDMTRIIFGSSEYVKDGLLPLTEWLGPSPWYDRMLKILDDLWGNAPVNTRHGRIVSTNQEINGEMLQVLSRVYWLTGDRKYLDWAIRLGDYYLLDNKQHPTENEKYLRLRDHGCEIVSGLCELYATVNFAMPEKKQAYQAPIHAMLDRILEVGRNEHGLFYNAINPKTGSHESTLCDTWGYNLSGYYTVYLVDGTASYRQAVLKALSSLNERYRNYNWEKNSFSDDSSDGYADSIESALNLVNREPVMSAYEWIDSEIKQMWNKQKPDGIIEGWHGDGNFARTTMMFCLWKTQGITIQPWRRDVVFGAVQDGHILKISIAAEKEWNGKIVFDIPRHKVNMKMPLDWPRINQFQEWFTVQSEGQYIFIDITNNSKRIFTGKEMHEGISMHLFPGEERCLSIQKVG